MNWLKGLGSSIWIGILAMLAAFAAIAANRHKAQAEKWKTVAVNEKSSDVSEGTRKAQQALTQAKFHEAKAEQAQKAAAQKIDAVGKKNETLAEVVDGWRK